MLDEEGEEVNLPPELDWLEVQYLQHFYELNTCRPPGYGVITYIPWTAVDRLAERYGYDDSEFGTMWQIIRRIDNEFIEHFTEKMKRK